MMIKITERCTMGCTHCMNDAKPDGQDMPRQILDDSLEFLSKYNLGTHFIITGGEPLEHSDFEDVINRICLWNIRHGGQRRVVTVTTNGEKIQDDYKTYENYITRCKGNGIELLFQVSVDQRYYPRRIKTHRKVFRSSGFILCDDCVQQIYPQGRAIENNIPWQSKASKCYNVRAIAKQIEGLPLAAEMLQLLQLEVLLAAHKKFCTPHISIHGEIKLGESDLCPACASIYDDEDTIMQKIREFQCHKCDMINQNLPDEYRKFVE